ncbi:MAG TPA: hypothetical protein VN515_07765, partial [Terriglobales bacterium]|nr:hypothetical protein [Terriglobales bacterium]
MPRQPTAATSLDSLRREAKRWLRSLRANDPLARERLATAYPQCPKEPGLRDVQHALALEHGYPGWEPLKLAVERAAGDRRRAVYEQAAQDYVDAYAGNAAALERLNRHYAREFKIDDLKAEIWRRNYAFRQRAFRQAANGFPLEEAQVIVAQDAGFGSWSTLMDAAASGAPPRGEPYTLDAKHDRIGPSRRLQAGGWDALIGAMKERRIQSLDANGLMTDAVLALVAGLDFVTELRLGGSRELTDDGLLQLARMPQLERLILSEFPGGKLTDRGLEVLRHLPNLRVFKMAWQAGIGDHGAANLRCCDRLEEVDLMGSPTGDGAVAALQGKPRLRAFSAGRLLTDAAIPMFHNFPLLRRNEAPGAKLLIDGRITNAGLASLAGLAGVSDLVLFWHLDRITGDGFAPLKHLPNLQSLGCDGRLSDNVALAHIAALPQLKRLGIQESVADDEGFTALARSPSIEGIWGRVCPNFGSRGSRRLHCGQSRREGPRNSAGRPAPGKQCRRGPRERSTGMGLRGPHAGASRSGASGAAALGPAPIKSRGFRALAAMPALRSLGIGCRNVEDAALATLPEFPALRELTPIDFQDEGFRHI